MSKVKEWANALRVLSVDAVEQAQSGHPGMPMGMADIATVLWRDFLSHNPKNPDWINRDRFIVSNGHGSMLLYALLHLTGYDLSIGDIKNFRQLDSVTPGHPEHGLTPGVETTTGPLGAGIANAVGMAIAEKILAAQFNRDQFDVMDHHTYVFAGDGCLMEGISHEVASLAGTLQLGKLVVFWDDNGISIDGETKDWFTDNTVERFRAYNWQVVSGVNGHDMKEVAQAIKTAKKETIKPTLICCKTNIGHGSPNNVGSAKVHGQPLGAEEVALMREQLSWPHEPFVVPDDIYEAWDAKAAGSEKEAVWQALFDQYAAQYPELAVELTRRLSGELPFDFQSTMDDLLAKTLSDKAAVASRRVTQHVLEACMPHLPELLGGSADLSSSNLTSCSHSVPFTPAQRDANYIYYGVREFGMASIMNGIALHQGFIPFGGTFLVFASYCANAIRMSALLKQRVIYVLTHDSIGLGEDGPTHQPVEQLPMLRAIPDLSVWRPADAVETVIAWESALQNQHQPTCLLLSRQSLPALNQDPSQLDDIRRGAYVAFETSDQPEIIIIATGSEVGLAVEVAKQASKAVRVVSMPSADVFERQDAAYKESVLPDTIRHRIAIEAASGDFWYKYVGREGHVIDLKQFGLSAPAAEVFKVCGFTVERILKLI